MEFLWIIYLSTYLVILLFRLIAADLPTESKISPRYTGCQVAVQAAASWCAASAGGEFANTMGKINTIAFAGWTTYFIGTQMQGNKAGFSENGVREGVAVCGLMALMNGLTFFA